MITPTNSYLLPRHNIWILRFKHFFSRRTTESFCSPHISIIDAFLIVCSNFHAEGFSFHVFYSTTHHLIVVNSWRREYDRAFLCYCRHKHVSGSFPLKEAAAHKARLKLCFSSSFCTEPFPYPLVLLLLNADVHGRIYGTASATGPPVLQCQQWLASTQH